MILMSIEENREIPIDWNALDKEWFDSYEADYGHFYSDIFSHGKV